MPLEDSRRMVVGVALDLLPCAVARFVHGAEIGLGVAYSGTIQIALHASHRFSL